MNYRIVATVILSALWIAWPCGGQEPNVEPPAAIPLTTAWNQGYPLKGFKNADALVASFKAKAKSLGKDEKLRILIIGDSLSDGNQHWSHYFRRNLQAAYGNGGYGAIWSGWAQYPQAIPGWLWDPKTDFSSQSKGLWRHSWGGRGDIWPYLGWNGDFLATDRPDAEYQLTARGSTFTVVYSAGTYTTFNGQSVVNRAAGFTASLDGESRVVPAAGSGEPLDMGLLKFVMRDVRHTLKIDHIHDGVLSLHGVLVENSAPGVVVYNISHGGWWAHSYLWRQPGWEKLLAACDPYLTIIFLSKPESGGSTEASDTRLNPEYEMLVRRVLLAVPHTKLLFFNCWEPRDGISPADAKTLAERAAWFEEHRYPYLDLQHGLNSRAMKELGWFQDNIHLAPAGGKGIGDAISQLFLP